MTTAEGIIAGGLFLVGFFAGIGVGMNTVWETRRRDKKAHDRVVESLKKRGFEAGLPLRAWVAPINLKGLDAHPDANRTHQFKEKI